MLDVLFLSDMNKEDMKRVLEQEFGIKMTREQKGEIDTMCNLSQGLVERSVKKGIGIGREEGREEGIGIGREEREAEIAARMQSLGYTQEQIEVIIK